MANLIESTIRFVFKGERDADKANDAVKELGDNAKKSASPISRLDDSLQGLGKAAAVSFGGIAVASVVSDAIQDFAQLERQVNSLSFSLDRLGLGGSTGQVVEALKALEFSGGALRQETIPQFQSLVRVTGDVNSALALTGLAADAAEAGVGNLEQNAVVLSQVLNGEVAPAYELFKINIFDANGAQREAADVLQDVIEQYSGAGDTISDTATQQARLTARINEAKLRIGEFASGIVDGLAIAADFVLKVGESIGAVLGGLIGQAEAAFTGVVNVFSQLDLVGLITGRTSLEEIGQNVREAVATGLRNFNFATEGGAEELERIWRGAGTIAGEAQAAGFDAALEQAARRDEARAREAAEKEAAARQAAAEKLAGERLRFEQQIADRELALRIAAAEDGSRVELELQRDVLNRQREAALEEARRTGADLLAVRRVFRLAEEQLDREFAQRRADEQAERRKTAADADRAIADELLQLAIADQANSFETQADLLREQLERTAEQRREAALESGADLVAVEELIAEERRQLEEDLAAAKTEIDREVRRQQIDNALAIAGTSVAAARELFGELKVIRIAEAIINTATGVTAALSTGNIGLAAAIAALGAAQVATIVGTTPGSSTGAGAFGGDGSNVVVAAPTQTIRGELPAVERPESGEAAAGAGAGVVQVFNGPVYDPGSLRELDRDLSRARRGDQRRLGSRS